MSAKERYLLLEERKMSRKLISLLTGKKYAPPETKIKTFKTEKDLGIHFLKNSDLRSTDLGIGSQNIKYKRRAIYSCEYCDKDFGEIGHKMFHREKRHRCKLCDKLHRDGDLFCKIYKVNIKKERKDEVDSKMDVNNTDIIKGIKAEKTEYGLKLLRRECSFCDYHSFDATEIYKHFRKKHAMRCRKCQKRYRYKRDLVAHKQECFRKIICDLCDKVLYKRDEYKVHKKQCENELRINLNLSKCSKCDFTSAKRENIRRHMVKQHPEAQKDGLKPHQFQCDTCLKIFTKKFKLLAHQKKTNHTAPSLTYRSANVLFPCDLCFRLDTKTACFQSISSDEYLIDKQK